MPRIRGHSAVKDPSEERANQHTQRNGKGRLQPFPFLVAGWMTEVEPATERVARRAENQTRAPDGSCSRS